jgi:hypothetical protein
MTQRLPLDFFCPSSSSRHESVEPKYELYVLSPAMLTDIEYGVADLPDELQTLLHRIAIAPEQLAIADDEDEDLLWNLIYCAIQPARDVLRDGIVGVAVNKRRECNIVPSGMFHENVQPIFQAYLVRLKVTDKKMSHLSMTPINLLDYPRRTHSCFQSFYKSITGMLDSTVDWFYKSFGLTSIEKSQTNLFVLDRRCQNTTIDTQSNEVQNRQHVSYEKNMIGADISEFPLSQDSDPVEWGDGSSKKDKATSIVRNFVPSSDLRPSPNQSTEQLESFKIVRDRESGHLKRTGGIDNTSSSKPLDFQKSEPKPITVRSVVRKRRAFSAVNRKSTGTKSIPEESSEDDVMP